MCAGRRQRPRRADRTVERVDRHRRGARPKKLAVRGAKQLPRKIKDRLTLKEATLIEAHRLDLPGVMVQVESRRNYLGGVAASHVLGYVGEVSAEQLDKPEFAELHQGSIVGQYMASKNSSIRTCGHGRPEEY